LPCPRIRFAFGAGPEGRSRSLATIQEELEKFFKATDELEDKKLNIIGWKGPKAAVKAINAAKSFKKNAK
jgi:hypothetical protein